MGKNLKNNKGFSLIELIIVLAILAILGSVGILSTRLVTNRQVTACAQKISSSLSSTRNLCLGRNTAYLEIWNDGSYICIQAYVDDDNPYGNEIQVGNGSLDCRITYKREVTGVTYTNTLDSTHQRITFLRGTGGVKSDGNYYPYTISVSNGTKTSIIKIDHITGRVAVE